MNYCTRCGTPRPSGGPFCTACGAPAMPPPEGDHDPWKATGPGRSPSRSRSQARSRSPLRVALAGLVVLAVIGAAGWAVFALVTGSPLLPARASGRPAAGTSAPADAPPQHASAAVTPSSVSASCQSPPSRDGGGNTVSYPPANVLDGMYDTAWRCDGDGVGQILEITFAGPVTVTGIGIVPGYAKTDGFDNTDRYAQNRRISAVRYTFDGGTSVTGNLNSSATYRSLQLTAVPDVRTSRMTVTILNTVPGEGMNDQPAVNKMAISEVVVSAR